MIRDDAVAALGLDVAVNRVDIQLARGKATIEGVKVANPEGFPSEHVFDLPGIHVDLSILSLIPAALGWRPYRVEEIRIEAPLVTVDIDEQGRTNLDQISRRVQQSRREATATRQPEPETSPAETPSQAPTTRIETRNELARFTIDRLIIDEPGFKLNRAGKQPESGTLPSITIEDVGGANGITAAGLGVKVSARLASEILAIVVLRKAGERLNQRAGGLLDQLFKVSRPTSDNKAQH